MAFAKSHRYTISTHQFDEWKHIHDESRRMYQEYGAKQLLTLVRTEGDTMHIIELGFYPSSDEYQRIAQQVDADPRIMPLFEKFLKLVPRETISEEEYQVH